jgi:phosphoribosylaminoimidazole (AIR) synthetase
MPDVFCWIQQKSNLSDNEMLKTFNCGIGMVLVLKQDNISSIIYNLVKKYDLVELGVLENN